MRPGASPQSRGYVCTGPGEVSSLITDPPGTPVIPRIYIYITRNRSFTSIQMCHTHIHTTLSHTDTQQAWTHKLPHTTLPRTTFHTQFFHTQIVTRNSFTHSLSHKNSSTHNSFTHNSFTYNIVTHNLSLSHTALSHTTLSHTALSPTVLSHNLSSPSHFHTCFELVGRSWHVGLSGPLIWMLRSCKYTLTWGTYAVCTPAYAVWKVAYADARQKKRLHERLRKFFDRKWSSQLLAAQPTQSCLRLKINKCLRADAALKTHMISLGFERESQIPRDALVE